MQETLLKLFSLGTIALLICEMVFIALIYFKKDISYLKFVKQFQNEILFYVSFVAVIASILLSVYFNLAPCELCWYQRMCLFPIPLIAGIALLKKDISARQYIFGLSLVGVVIALYHSILQMNLFKTVSVFCNPLSAVDCATPDFIYFGFVTIPVMSVAVFVLLLILSYGYPKKS